ncbi:MAG: RluA family pseudouridine synthase [Planctomycetota bacterium]
MSQPASTSNGHCDLKTVLPAEHAGLRVDVSLTQILPHLSRNYIRLLLNDGAILINNKSAKPSRKTRGGEQVSIELPKPEIIEARPEDIPLDILYEDHDIIVLHKPAGMVTHPSSGHITGSLVNALLFHCKDLSAINGALRPGIVHRLDKDTSGVIVAAKNDTAHRSLAGQFAAREVSKEYLALCHGHPPQNEFFSDARIGRHPIRRTEMTVMREDNKGRDARTDFVALEQFTTFEIGDVFFVRALPRTGRTHQIRVHLAKMGYPILADGLYGKEKALPDYGLLRHALHAQAISFLHPITKKKLRFEAKIADDIEQALRKLRAIIR